MRYLFAEGERFQVWRYSNPPSLEIVRKGDGANCYFQSGEDSNAFEDELENALRAHEQGTLKAEPTDYVCESYEHVLRFET